MSIVKLQGSLRNTQLKCLQHNTLSWFFPAFKERTEKGARKVHLVENSLMGCFLMRSTTFQCTPRLLNEDFKS